jgi:uncharacterized DUF497 family protein
MPTGRASGYGRSPPRRAANPATGRTAEGRYVFLMVMPRVVDGQTKLRQISARYMHQKEVDL